MYFKILLILAFISIYGCKGGSAISLDTSTDTPPTGGTQAETCTDKTIDTGLKGAVAVTARGAFSDIKTIPGTNKYASVYYDASALAMMISYWNGSSYTHEVVAGDTAATFIRLEFVSTGRPLIFWTNGGTDLKMASRSTAFGAAGTWSIGIIDSVVAGANRTLEVSVSPNDEVAIIYLSTNTAATAKPRFVYCNSSCTASANYINMSASENIESTGAVTYIVGQVATGVSWCGVDTNADLVVDDYYPAVAYTAAASNSRYAVCAQGNLANCLSSANWTKTNFATTSNLASKLYIDPTVVNGTPKIASLKPTIGVITYEGNTGCSSVAAFTASNQTIGGATTGNAWLELLKTSDGRFHIITNETTTNVRYYNTTGANFISSVANPNQWNTVGNFATTTLLAASATSGGADVLTNGKIISTYYQGAVSFNLFAGVVQDPSTSSASTTLSSNIINARGGIQFNATQTRNISTDSTSTGLPGIAYVDFSAGALTSGRLKYSFRNSVTKSSSWTTVLVPFVGASPLFPSLKYDNQDRPWISYFDSNVGNSKFYLMTNSASDGQGQWYVYQFPINTMTGAYALPATNDTALAMYNSGGISYPVMAVIDNNNTTKGVKVAKLDPATGGWSAITLVEDFTSSATSGAWLSMDNNEAGEIVIAFQDFLTATPTSAGVEYAYSADGGATFTSPKAVSATLGDGQGLSLKINPLTNTPAISYFGRATNSVSYATCADTFSNCALSGWTSTVVENAANTSTAYAVATTDQLLTTALSFNSDGEAHLFHPVGMGNVIGSSAGGNLVKVIIDSALALTSSNYVYGVNASAISTVNFAAAGHNVSSVETSQGELLTAFIGAGNYLAVRSCGVE